MKNVIVLGHVQDENGQKMSKSKGNAVDPFDALTDVWRRRDPLVLLYQQCSVAAEPFPWQGSVQEGQRKFMGTLWNTYAFFVLYANIDEFRCYQVHPGIR